MSKDVISKVKFTNTVVSFLLSMIDFKSKLNDVHCTCPGHSLDKDGNIQSNDTRCFPNHQKLQNFFENIPVYKSSSVGAWLKNNSVFLVKYKPVIITSLGLNLEVS